ncbi:MAG: Flp pilus assembly complex ATPase component TadA [Sedimentisphaerales bacterium]|nr:Flp pilus assembly complex ATPase component TadA [Sedimentisphaerales bacterium]
MNEVTLGQILLKETDLSLDQLDMVLRLQQTRRPKPSLGELLVEKGFINRRQLCQALAIQWEIPFIENIPQDKINHDIIAKIPIGFLKSHRILPLTTRDNGIIIAIDNPLDLEAIDSVANIAGRYCRRAIASTDDLETAISRYYFEGDKSDHGEKSNVNGEEILTDNIAGRHREDILNVANIPPVVKLVNKILFTAVSSRASDIHIEPYENEAKIRFRIDGVLQENLVIPKKSADPLISRLKLTAGMNIAEKRLPQDGQCRIKVGDKNLDIRISSVPASGGERLVLRLLEKSNRQANIDSLGLEPDIKSKLINLTNRPHGIVLLTGPTGSGKTTTLYCMLNEINTHERNILTVEDPIEYELPGIGQMQIKPKIGLTFGVCLKHILRQDPDVIMIGEIRDNETAEIATHASLTGHLVLSTLHTNDSASAIFRLQNIGVEPYLIASALNGVMAQRLVRTICPMCKTECRTEYDTHEILQHSSISVKCQPIFYTGVGCEYCGHTGYHNRIAIAELLIVDDEIRALICKNTPSHIIKEKAVERGMLTLRDDGLRHALTGTTSVEEVLRVTQDSI